MSKTAIILSAFGSSSPAHQRVREMITADYQAAFPDYAIRLALSSARVRKAECLPDMSTIIDELRQSGHTNIVVQHLLLIPGQMFAEAQEMPSGITVRIGAPLLSTDDDLDWLAQHIGTEVPAGLPTILALHGNTRNPQHNAIHLALAARLAQSAPELVIASLEGEPGLDPLYAFVASARAAGKAHIMPLFLFPGGHVMDDLLGDDPASWRSILGVPCSHAPTLLEQPALRQRFVAHTQATLAVP